MSAVLLKFSRFNTYAAILAFVVVILGAFTRLSDAGLGCPDWPGCYGQLLVPEDEAAIVAANEAYPERPVEGPKAWKEMVHRYFAGTLGLVILFLGIHAWRQRYVDGQPVAIPVFLVGLVTFQAILGMWTVTLLLKPVVVMAHLIGGLSTLSLLVWVALRSSNSWRIPEADAHSLSSLKPIAVLGLIVVAFQIALGGWTSANYAALACYDFPTCQNQWWPQGMDFGEAFVLWRGLGVDYEFGVLSNEARMAIHVAHRIGAAVTVLIIGFLAFKLLMSTNTRVKTVGALVAILLFVQVSLGIANVVMNLPIGIATAHNGVAALLLLSLVLLNHTLRPRVFA